MQSICRRAKTALLEGNLETLLKLARKGKKLTPEIIQDRKQKVGALVDCTLTCKVSLYVHVERIVVTTCCLECAGGEPPVRHSAGA